MKVVFDQCTPKQLREALPQHDVQTADEAGMGSLKNGDLIDEGCGSFASAVQRGPGGAASGMARAT